jgi:hypothetical protein
MHKPLIFGAAMTLGCALFAFAATLEGQHGVEPSIEPSPDAVRVIPPDAPIWVKEPEVSAFELPEVVVTATARTARLGPAASERRPRPCSHWRVIGPAYVDDEGNASGERRVRELCE